ncbi:MAG: isochorismatase family cysteine hydrolase [Ilumatobacteraceae bacterium]|nr:isochorismatase family cysteine hydrolase [Ilumatobacteraceae bacterium]
MLHEWHIERREIERHLARRGSEHAFAEIVASRTALVVVDLVPFFTQSNPYAAGVIPNVNALARSVRSGGGVVAWIVPSATEPNAARRALYGSDVADRYRRSGGDGEVFDRLDPDLAQREGDLGLEKDGASAFFPGSCELHDELRRRSIDTVLIAGTVADVCCASSARDALEHGYRVVMVADANAANRDADLNATLHTIYRSFGDVRSTADLVGTLSG